MPYFRFCIKCGDEFQPPGKYCQHCPECRVNALRGNRQKHVDNSNKKIIEKIDYIKDITRINFPLSNVKVWSDGECKGLKKWIGFNFTNHLFVSSDKRVTLYCDKEEVRKFDKKIAGKLNGKFFDRLVDKYFELVKKATKTSSDKNLIKLLTELWPILTIFHEASLYPELLEAEDKLRLERIRKSTENKVYTLFGKLKEEVEGKNYYCFRGIIYPGKPSKRIIKLS